MNTANRVVVLRIERSEPVHISEVIAELLPKLEFRSEPTAGRLELSLGAVGERNRQAETACQPCV